jgi:hypothetical protein
MWHAWEKRKVYKILVGKPEGKGSLERPMCRWEDGIKQDLRETGWEGVEWIYVTQVRERWQAVVITVMKLRVLAPWS